mmetsp:Transcript_16808/g.54733  ORF Transcript_16808/g.54733 Transcript_16808/m.54733 type:complete len:250 (-) Transcript_16808:555-1304(-)
MVASSASTFPAASSLPRGYAPPEPSVPRSNPSVGPSLPRSNPFAPASPLSARRPGPTAAAPALPRPSWAAQTLLLSNSWLRSNSACNRERAAALTPPAAQFAGGEPAAGALKNGSASGKASTAGILGGEPAAGEMGTMPAAGGASGAWGGSGPAAQTAFSVWLAAATGFSVSPPPAAEWLPVPPALPSTGKSALPPTGNTAPTPTGGIGSAGRGKWSGVTERPPAAGGDGSPSSRGWVDSPGDETFPGE